MRHLRCFDLWSQFLINVVELPEDGRYDGYEVSASSFLPPVVLTFSDEESGKQGERIKLLARFPVRQ